MKLIVHNLFINCVLLLLFSATVFGQGATTATITGKIKDTVNDPLTRAQVVAVCIESAFTGSYPTAYESKHYRAGPD